MITLRISGNEDIGLVDLDFEAPEFSNGNVRISTFKSIKEAREWVNKTYGVKPVMMVVDEEKDD